MPIPIIYRSNIHNRDRITNRQSILVQMFVMIKQQKRTLLNEYTFSDEQHEIDLNAVTMLKTEGVSLPVIQS